MNSKSLISENFCHQGVVYPSGIGSRPIGRRRGRKPKARDGGDDNIICNGLTIRHFCLLVKILGNGKKFEEGAWPAMIVDQWNSIRMARLLVDEMNCKTLDLGREVLEPSQEVRQRFSDPLRVASRLTYSSKLVPCPNRTRTTIGVAVVSKSRHLCQRSDRH